MFSRFMNVAKINKLIAKQRKLAKENPDSGYTAIISALLENEAKGTFKHYPEYMRKSINSFYVESIQAFKQTDIYTESMRNSGRNETNDFIAIISAVSQQALICGDMSIDEIKSHLDNVDNLTKVLVNIKLLPERFLNEEISVDCVA